MIPLGYLYKCVTKCPEWVKTPQVADIYSISGCVSEDFADYIQYWKHNGYWLFNSPAELALLAGNAGISLQGQKLFYYEAYELQYDEDEGNWSTFEPEPSFFTDVVIPARRELEGFDVATFSLGNTPECSPLSCNALAEKVPVNKHCLFESFDEAKTAVEQRAFDGSEPGPFRIIAVYSVLDGGGLEAD
jgi:hypothetical protein